MLWLLLVGAVVVVLAARTADAAETRRLNALIWRRYGWTLLITVPGLYVVLIQPLLAAMQRHP